MSAAYATGIVVAAISNGLAISIAIGVGGLVAGALYALVKVQGDRINDAAKVHADRINDARSDFTKNVEALDAHFGARLDELSKRLEQHIEAVAERLESRLREDHVEVTAKIDALTSRLEHVEAR